MIGYLGSPGAMVALPYRGGLSTATDRPVSHSRTLGGKRKSFVGPRGRREWDVSFDLIGSRDTHGLLAVAQSAGPVVWYPADASAGNLLSPQATGFEVTPNNGSSGGLVSLPDGTVARSVVHTGGSVVYVGNTGPSFSWEMVAVSPGVPISVGVWARGGSRITGSFRDVNGTHLTTPDSGTQTNAGWTWQTATFTPPATAVNYIMALSAGTQYARPVVSRGAVAVDRPGRGCPAAVVHGLSEALTVMSPDDAYGSISVTITEVG